MKPMISPILNRRFNWRYILCVMAATTLGVVACSSKDKHAESTSGEIALPPTFQQGAADIAAGEKINQQGTAQGVVACIGCHGAQGEGQAAGGFPRIANHSRLYLATQLRNYKSGARDNPVMKPIAAAMSDQDVENVAAYFEQVARPAYPPAPKMSAADLKRGRQIADVGDAKIGLQSCANCHGPGGAGQPPVIPYLAGQFAAYTEAQLQAWKSGARKTNPEHMGYIAKLLSDRDIKIVAAYFQQSPTNKANFRPPEIRTSKTR